MDPDKIRKKSHNYMQYSGLGFQFAAMIALGIIVGKWLDSKFEMTQPVFVLILTLVFFIGFMYKLYIELIKNK